jgi:serine/threonine-protein kinase mTOR
MFQCVGMLATAVGPNLTKLLHDQLDLMFACGLSEPLHHALKEIAKNIPPLLKTIQGMFRTGFSSLSNFILQIACWICCR